MSAQIPQRWTQSDSLIRAATHGPRLAGPVAASCISRQESCCGDVHDGGDDSNGTVWVGIANWDDHRDVRVFGLRLLGDLRRVLRAHVGRMWR